MANPFLPWGPRRHMAHCGWTLEEQVKLSVLCRLRCSWRRDWGKGPWCSGNAAERISWLQGCSTGSLQVWKNCCSSWVSWARDGCWTRPSCPSWDLCCGAEHVCDRCGAAGGQAGPAWPTSTVHSTMTTPQAPGAATNVITNHQVADLEKILCVLNECRYCSHLGSVLWHTRWNLHHASSYEILIQSGSKSALCPTGRRGLLTGPAQYILLTLIWWAL